MEFSPLADKISGVVALDLPLIHERKLISTMNLLVNSSVLVLINTLLANEPFVLNLGHVNYSQSSS